MCNSNRNIHYCNKQINMTTTLLECTCIYPTPHTSWMCTLSQFTHYFNTNSIPYVCTDLQCLSPGRYYYISLWKMGLFLLIAIRVRPLSIFRWISWKLLGWQMAQSFLFCSWIYWYRYAGCYVMRIGCVRTAWLSWDFRVVMSHMDWQVAQLMTLSAAEMREHLLLILTESDLRAENQTTSLLLCSQLRPPKVDNKIITS